MSGAPHEDEAFVWALHQARAIPRVDVAVRYITGQRHGPMPDEGDPAATFTSRYRHEGPTGWRVHQQGHIIR